MEHYLSLIHCIGDHPKCVRQTYKWLGETVALYRKSKEKRCALSIHTHTPGHFLSLQERTSSPEPSQGYPWIPVPSHIRNRRCQPESQVLEHKLQ